MSGKAEKLCIAAEEAYFPAVRAYMAAMGWPPVVMKATTTEGGP